jgi:mannose-6-phosphate isomerase-like protein (cupin superfamily)
MIKQKLIDIVKHQSLVIDEDIMFNLLQIKRRWPIQYTSGQPTVEIINNFNSKNFGEIFDYNGYLNFTTWKHYYDLGFTTIISNVLDLTNELRELNYKLANLIGKQINGNFYFSKGTTTNNPSFKAHQHNYEVLVKPIYGLSKWIIDDQNIEIEPGQLIWLEKNQVHQVVESKEPKLSLTLNVGS